MALPLPVGSPMGALVATSLTENGGGGVFPSDSSFSPRSRLLEVGAGSFQTDQQAGMGFVAVQGLGVSVEGEWFRSCPVGTRMRAFLAPPAWARRRKLESESPISCRGAPGRPLLGSCKILTAAALFGEEYWGLLRGWAGPESLRPT